MIKSYVIDTNILIQAPYACQCFEENRVILPLVVLEELDGLKKAEGEKGANARRAIRFLEKLRMKGDLLKGVELENGGFLRVEANCVGVELPESLPEDKADNRILKVCKGISDEEKPVVLVTKDLVLRIKAQIMGIEAQDFSTEQVIAGTAKTFYSLAVGLEKILNNPTGEYRRILICRPNAQFDSDIGFLPGDEQEKISPLMRPIMDNLEQLIDSDEEARYQDEQELQGKIEEIFARGIIQAEAMNFIRGRSFVNTYLIIDEAQNMTPNQVKGIITRAGKGTKIVLLGDPNQIDRPFLDERTNGLSYASEYMKGSPLCYQITMSAEECERSELAMDAIRRL